MSDPVNVGGPVPPELPRAEVIQAGEQRAVRRADRARRCQQFVVTTRFDRVAGQQLRPGHRSHPLDIHAHRAV